MNKATSLPNKLSKQFLAGVFALFTLAEFSYANPTPEETPDIIYSNPEIFQGFHDPGWLISADGKEYWFHYKGFIYDNISTWKEGRKINLTYSKTQGTQLRDPQSGVSARVEIRGIHLIE